MTNIARLAYDAYSTHLGGLPSTADDPPRGWDALGPQVKEAWAEAATAVAWEASMEGTWEVTDG